MAGVKGRSGGARQGGGRKSKAVELKLLEKLNSVLGDGWEDSILISVKEQADKGSFQHQSLLLAYRYGKPQDKVDVTTNGKSLPTSKEIVFRRYDNS